MPVRVLIVDDLEPFRRAALAVVVQATAGIEVAGEAVSGEESFDAAQALRPDLVLMDVNMPGISGMEATRRIRAAFPGIGVLLSSVRDTNERGLTKPSAAPPLTSPSRHWALSGSSGHGCRELHERGRDVARIDEGPSP